MAGLAPAVRRISASQQFGAVAWLRWRLFVNGFRRKGGTGELVARVIVFPFATLFVLGPVAGASLGAWAAAANGHLEYLAGIFWGIFLLQILVSINIAPPGLNFDPESLIRYPLEFSRYIVIRLFLGLLSASTIIGTCALLATAAGVTVAVHGLAGIAFASALVLAVTNMLFIRMVFAWVDRLLSTRRARELFTGLIFAGSIGIQYINVTFNGMGRHTSHAAQRAKIAAFLGVYRYVEPLLHHLPPTLGGEAIVRASRTTGAGPLVPLGGILLYGLVFLAVFAWRMQREYRGENLSEAATRPTQPAARAHLKTETGAGQQAISAPAKTLIPAVVAACFEKEWIYVRRNPAQLYGLVAPLAMVFIFAGRMGTFGRTGMVFPAAVAYSVLGVAALAYNALGLDASGVQFYFMAPISIRSVILAKNLFGFSIMAIQLALVLAVIVFISGRPPLAIMVSTMCWVVFASLVNATIGNMRSITAPKKIDPSKVSRRQASQLSALMCVGIMLAVAAVGAALIGFAKFADLPWLPVPVLLVFALGAFALYVTGLNRVDGLARRHRETLIEELSKTS